MRPLSIAFSVLLVTLLGASLASAQQSSDSEQPKRIFGIIPNYRTSPTLTDYEPINVGEKFRVATDDSFDRGMFVLAALFAGEGQLTNANRSFGRGLPAFARYYAASFTDFAVGDYMTEAIYPTLLHQDPRYFRRGSGSRWARLANAVGQIAVTHSDAGTLQFNASEVVGNASAVAIANSYYRDDRSVSANLTKLAIQLGVDMAANVVKEFGPDVAAAFARR